MTRLMKEGDARLGSVVEEGKSDGDVVLIGFPFDEGVRRNGGRVGARHGPEMVRKYLHKMGCVDNLEYGVNLDSLCICDYGDAEGQDFESSHRSLKAKVDGVLGKGGIPFIIGGGNDESFSNVCPLLERGGGVGVVNIDAHLDVRPFNDEGLAHSGSPFRQMLEHPSYAPSRDQFVVFAAQGSQCSSTHVKFLESKGGRVVWLKELRNVADMKEYFTKFLDGLGEHIFVSFDLDSVRGSDAPGVSCSSCIGLSAQDALDIMYASGAHPNVDLVDLSEFNPDIEEYRTGRLVVNMFYYFCLGRASRT